MPSTSELLLRWDTTRARSQQRAIGWSEVGGCRRRAGYRLAGVVPTTPSSSVVAVMGTAVHDAVEVISRELGLLTENEISFAGIVGHYDRLEADGTEVVDVKTVGTDRYLERIELAGPPQAHVWQVTGYGAGLVRAGHPVRTVRIDYLARDTGREYTWRARFDPAVLREALAWLTQVRSVALDMLPRDYLPDSAFCGHCPFREPCWGQAVPERSRLSALYVDDPDAEKWAQRLYDLRAQIKELREQEKRAAGALDAIRPPAGNRAAAGRFEVEYRPTATGTLAVHLHPHRGGA